jgi:hypothetical protein
MNNKKKQRDLSKKLKKIYKNCKNKRIKYLKSKKYNKRKQINYRDHL